MPRCAAWAQARAGVARGVGREVVRLLVNHDRPAHHTVLQAGHREAFHHHLEGALPARVHLQVSEVAAVAGRGVRAPVVRAGVGVVVATGAGGLRVGAVAPLVDVHAVQAGRGT